MSGIYIPGMEMPKRNFLDLRIQPNWVVYEFEGGYHLYYKTDKAMNVPDHGRLIDADALEELFREVIGNISKRDEIKPVLEHMVRASAMAVEMIKDAPTIIPAEEGDSDV